MAENGTITKLPSGRGFRRDRLRYRTRVRQKAVIGADTRMTMNHRQKYALPSEQSPPFATHSTAYANDIATAAVRTPDAT